MNSITASHGTKEVFLTLPVGIYKSISNGKLFIFEKNSMTSDDYMFSIIGSEWGYTIRDFLEDFELTNIELIHA